MIMIVFWTFNPNSGQIFSNTKTETKQSMMLSWWISQTQFILESNWKNLPEKKVFNFHSKLWWKAIFTINSWTMSKLIAMKFWFKIWPFQVFTFSKKKNFFPMQKWSDKKKKQTKKNRKCINFDCYYIFHSLVCSIYCNHHEKFWSTFLSIPWAPLIFAIQLSFLSLFINFLPL